MPTASQIRSTVAEKRSVGEEDIPGRHGDFEPQLLGAPFGQCGRFTGQCHAVTPCLNSLFIVTAAISCARPTNEPASR